MSDLDWGVHDAVRVAADKKYAAEIGPADIQEYDETMTNMAKAFKTYGLDLRDPVVLHSMYGLLTVGSWLMMRDIEHCGDQHMAAHISGYVASVALFLREQAKYAGVPAVGG